MVLYICKKRNNFLLNWFESFYTCKKDDKFAGANLAHVITVGFWLAIKNKRIFLCSKYGSRYQDTLHIAMLRFSLYKNILIYRLKINIYINFTFIWRIVPKENPNNKLTENTAPNRYPGIKPLLFESVTKIMTVMKTVALVVSRIILLNKSSIFCINL